MAKIEELLDIGEEKWEKLMELGRPRTFKAGEMLFMQGEASEFLYCIKAGIVKNSIYMPNGKEKIIHFLLPPALTGQSGIFDNLGNICSATALTEVCCIAVSRSKFIAFLFENPQVMYRICWDLVKKARCTQSQAEDVYNTVPQKLARFLLDACQYGIVSRHKSSSIAFTHDEIANLLGTTRQRVTQYLNDFEKQGLIQKGVKNIKVLDAGKLAQYL
ncbi:MAG: Crp/Fnr family transcriptional regulator [Gracilibacteraceae bacterium]|jgi:CRP/FNR family transcriptional regulator|nr:Crp/Fnr family transcriptional regulator [Gracilibacteraceae bacterium]